MYSCGGLCIAVEMAMYSCGGLCITVENRV